MPHGLIHTILFRLSLKYQLLYGIIFQAKLFVFPRVQDTYLKEKQRQFEILGMNEFLIFSTPQNSYKANIQMIYYT